MTVIGIVKMVKLLLWAAGCALVGFIFTRATGMVRDRDMVVVLLAILGLLIGLFMETFSGE